MTKERIAERKQMSEVMRAKRKTKRNLETYVVACFTEASKVRNVTLRLVRRRRWPTTAGGGLGDGRGRSLGRSDTRVHVRGDGQTGLRLVRQHGRVAHVGRGLLVGGETELQAIGATVRASVGNITGGTGGGDGHGGLAGVVALRGSRGRGAIDDRDAGGLGLLHGFAAHRRF